MKIPVKVLTRVSDIDEEVLNSYIPQHLKNIGKLDVETIRNLLNKWRLERIDDKFYYITWSRK